jgi:hypothetical protein
MSSDDQARADAANNSYKNRPQSDVDSQHPAKVVLNGQEYTVFGYKDDSVTGFHATAYRSRDTNEIIIAYRGTDPALFSGKTKAERRDHALTTVQDIAVDATMVRDTVNPQKAAADAFTQAMIDKAAQQGISKDHVSVTGHSLGGTLAEIEAAKYGLTGSTYNAYGAAGLTDGPSQPGTHLTNYRMAGDVVSAANGHIGEVVSLSSEDDVQSLHDGRYLDAPAGAPPPNALIAMRLDDHDGQRHFGSQSPDNVLEPHRFQEAARRYADHKAAFDHFSGDISRERGELSRALTQMQEHYGLPPDIQRQVNEYLALHADQPVRHAIEHSDIAQGIEHTLQQGADVVRAGGHYVQTQDERMASAARAAGAYAVPVSPLAPLVGLAAGEAAHLQGQATDAMGRFVGDQLQSAKGAVEQGAHHVAQTVVGDLHDPDVQASAANLVNHVVNAYHDVQATGQAVDAAGQAVSHGVDVAERAAGQAYDTLTHPGQWFHHGAPAATATAGSAGSAPSQAPAVTSTDPGCSRHDPRHSDSPHHPLYRELKTRIPQASENRLLQFTAACHKQGLTTRNLGQITYLEEVGQMEFWAHAEPRPPAIVDVRTPSPAPQQSIEQIQQTDLSQAQWRDQLQRLALQQETTLGGFGR